jgi:hypothetical protein
VAAFSTSRYSSCTQSFGLGIFLRTVRGSYNCKFVRTFWYLGSSTSPPESMAQYVRYTCTLMYGSTIRIWYLIYR